MDGKITLEAADFNCTKLLIAASVRLASGVDRAAAPPVSSSVSRLTPGVDRAESVTSTVSKFELSASAAREVMLSCSSEVAEALLSFLAGAVRSLHDRFARYKEVDKATLRHFVEHGMSTAAESSEKEKGENTAPPSRASEASAK
jgi:hypothetical protein